MPKPSVSTATAVNQGLRRSIRNPNVTSFMMEGMAISGPATLNIRTCNSHSNRNSLQAHENCLATCPIVGPVCPEVARRVGQTSRSLRMGQRHTNRDENPAVGQALGLRRPLRPPGQAFHNLRWVFDCARVLQDPLLASRNQPSGHGRPTWTSAAGLVLPHAPPVSPDSWLWLCLPVTPVPTPPRCTRPPHWLEWTFAQSATWHSSSETVSRKSTSP